MFIWPIDRTLSGATTPGESGPGSYGNEGVLPSSRTGASQSDGLVSYPGHSLAGVLPLCIDAVGVSYNPSTADWAVENFWTTKIHFFYNDSINSSVNILQYNFKVSNENT